MSTKIIAWILSFLSFFMFWSPNAQPNNIPETRVSPYGEELPPDKYGVWPTQDFTAGKAPDWLKPSKILKKIEKNNNYSWSDGFLVLHKGEIVHEEYFNGYDKDTPHYMASVTKSVTSALVGIAVGEGLIGGVQDKVVDYFPDAVIPAGQESKKDMTIEHLLTMTSGILCEAEADWNSYFSEDMTDAALWAFLLPQKTAPGKKFAYDNVAPSILLGIIERTSGQNALDFAREKLFEPLGMRSVQWDTTADGLPCGAFGISMTPRDMARFGYLYLNYGRWEDKQLLPADWVVKTPPRAMASRAYGYMFWNYRLEPFSGAYEANGAGGQFIIIQPNCDTVIVRTGDENHD